MPVLEDIESVAEYAVMQWAEERGILQTKLNLMGQRGFPDRCFWIPGGKPVLMEFKRRNKKPRKLQHHIIEKLKRLGYDSYCVDRKEDGIHLLLHCIGQAIGGKKQSYDFAKDKQTQASRQLEPDAGKRTGRHRSKTVASKKT